LFAPAPPANPSASRDSEAAWLTRVATWHSSFFDLLTQIRPAGWCGRTSPASCHRARRTGLWFLPRGLGQLGYGWAYRVLDAQHFGVPQRRRRVFVVGCLGDWRGAAAVLFERHCLSGHPAPGREAGAGVAGCFTAGAHPGSHNGQDAYTGHLIAGTLGSLSHGRGWNDDPDRAGAFVTTSLRTQDSFDHDGDESKLVITHALRAEGFDASEDGMGRGTPLVPVGFSYIDDGRDASHDVMPTLRVGTSLKNGSGGGIGGNGAIAFAERGTNVSVDGDLAATLKSASDNTGGRQCVAFAQNQRDELRTMDSVGALAAEPGMKQQTYLAYSVQAAHRGVGQGHNTTYVPSPMAVRRLTPRECERLQGFPDDYTLIPFRGKSAADGPRYRALGNSMAVPVLRWIGERIVAAAGEAVPK
jgi:DNA (cytosine-5)-methyltransferase 1